MKLGKTQRGFELGQFEDRYKSKCSIQDSSLATEDCIWLGVHEDFEGRRCTRMHLTQDMVRQLLPLLQFFVANGRLPEDDAEKEEGKDGI